MKIKHKIFILVLIILSATSLFAFSNNEETVFNLYINNTLIETDYPVLNVDGSVVVPMSSLFDTLGAQIYFHNATNTLSSYHLNTYVKVDLDHKTMQINGKTHTYEKQPFIMDRVVYVPIGLMIRAFDFNVVEGDDEHGIYLSANSLIQYKNYDDIPYQQVSSDDDGIRYSIPLYWDKLGNNLYGYNTSYGENSMHFTTRDLNDNIDINFIIDTYKEHLMMEYGDNVIIGDLKQRFFTYLTSNVLYITVDVNGKPINKIIHFIPAESQIYIITFAYTDGLSESYIIKIFDIIMNSFYIDETSVDTDAEHYIEYSAARELGLHLSDDIFSNMTLEKHFILDGYLNTDEIVKSLTITVSRDEERLQFYVPVENNSFHSKVYTPFGLGKHNIKIEVAKAEEKVTFPENEESNDQELPRLDNSKTDSSSSLLMQFSVVNLSKDNIRYKIPTKNVQSEDEYLKSMSMQLSYNYHTSYSKAKNLYDFIHEYVEVLQYNEENRSAKDVYIESKGTKKEIALYLTALLRAQDIPARVIEGQNEYVKHHWTEAYLNGNWIIIDPAGDQTIFEDISVEKTTTLDPSFNASPTKYSLRYPEQTILEY